MKPFAHKISDLSFSEKIKKGVIFTHTSKMLQKKYTYGIVDIEYGKPRINDAVILHDLDTKDDCFSVEPEWFNQRITNVK